MAVVLRVADVECILYPYMLPPAYVYARVGGKMAVFTLDPEIQRVRHDAEMRPEDIRKADQIVKANRGFLLKQWDQL